MLAPMMFALLFGIILSSFVQIPEFIERTSGSLLLITMFLIGLEIAQNKMVFENINRHPKNIIFLSISIILGTFFGSIIAGIILGIHVKNSLLIGAGMGFYTLSSSMINNAGLINIAAIAFLSNLLRELLGLFLAPILSQVFPYSSAAIAGAATDTVLPSIARYNNDETVIVSLCTSVLLTILVPVFIALLLSL